jgi:hypothetical protein
MPLYNNKIKISKKEYRNTRKKYLEKKITELKLPYIKNICDSYIKFGDPPINEIITMLHDDQCVKNERLYQLSEKLRENNLIYDEKIPSYRKYIKNGKNLDNVIKNGEIEKILIEKGNYLLFADDIDSDTAKEMSLNKFYDDGNEDDIIDNYVKNRNIIKFE